MSLPLFRVVLPVGWLLSTAGAMSGECPVDLLAANNVVWNSPSEDSRGSMPLGNGDIGLNVWVEKNGDLLFYISKTDAWSDNVAANKGLPKVGRVRLRLSPSLPVDTAFSQTLRLDSAQIEIRAGAPSAPCLARVWVDANQPVIHLETDLAEPRGLKLAFETTRPAPGNGLQADTIFPGQSNRVVWCYRNQNKQIASLTNRNFGAGMAGKGLAAVSSTALRSTQPARQHRVWICALTAQTPTPEAWLEQLNRLMAQAESAPLETARRQHADWWRQFWNRSWIFLSGDPEAAQVTRGYVLQRFVSACAGRGDYPIKFNGSIFTMDWQKRDRAKGVETNYLMSADARDWGGQYWFQNTRPMYWPMLQSGDFDLMQPLFKMFRDMLPSNARQVREFYGHDGAYFAETAAFWGGIPKIRPGEAGSYTKHYFTPILELSAMMLDYFAYTGDREFVRQNLLPIADAGVTFFDQHFPRDAKGKLLLEPDNAIEMFWKARNPAPDIAGLNWVLTGLLGLPGELTTGEMRSRWQRLRQELPELPVGETNGVKVLLPAEAYDQGHNFENPELYAVYPFRLYGLAKPNLALARATFDARRFKDDGCWRQSGIQAALLGDTATAQKNVLFVLRRQDPQVRFPAFWAHGSDYVPDEDNGGNGLNALQLMLLQSEGKRLVLLPAWPANWSASFKLHAPFNTVVEGRVRAGKVEALTITPAERLADVVLL